MRLSWLISFTGWMHLRIPLGCVENKLVLHFFAIPRTQQTAIFSDITSSSNGKGKLYLSWHMFTSHHLSNLLLMNFTSSWHSLWYQNLKRTQTRTRDNKWKIHSSCVTLPSLQCAMHTICFIFCIFLFIHISPQLYAVFSSFTHQPDLLHSLTSISAPYVNVTYWLSH